MSASHDKVPGDLGSPFRDEAGKVPGEAGIVVYARWDDEAGVWVAESDQVPGLVTEAETLEHLATKLEGLIPELLELNAPDLHGQPTVNLKAERTLRYAV